MTNHDDAILLGFLFLSDLLLEICASQVSFTREDSESTRAQMCTETPLDVAKDLEGRY